MNSNEDVNENKAVTPSEPQNGKPVRGDEATRWKPGQSGNPGGRPKRTPLADACREVLSEKVPGDANDRTNARAIAEKLVAMAIAGDIRAIQEVGDRGEGRARQSIEIEHIRLREAFDRMNSEELEAYAHDGVLPGWFPKDEIIQ